MQGSPFIRRPVKPSTSFSGRPEEVDEMSSTGFGGMGRRCQSVPTKALSAEDDYIFSRRSSEIRQQKYANCSELPPPGKFSKTYSAPCRISTTRSWDKLKAECFQPDQCFEDLDKSLQVSILG
jgi:hypothetical protein